MPGRLSLQLGACSQCGGGCCLWDGDCPSPSGSGCRPPASLPPAWGGTSLLPTSFPLVSIQSFVLWAGQAVPQSFSQERCLSLSLFFFLVIPWFGLLTLLSSLRLSTGHSDPVPTLCRQPMLPCSGLACCRRKWASGLPVRGLWVLFFSPPNYVALRDSKTPHRPAGEISWCLESSLPSWLPHRDRSLSLTLLSLFLFFIFCPTSFWRQRAAFLGSWCPLPAFRSCFVEFAQCSNDLSMNLWGRKWSPHPIPLSSSRIQPINFFKVSCQTNGLDNMRKKLSIILTRAVKLRHSQTVAPDK